jgi:hypothetical protein
MKPTKETLEAIKEIEKKVAEVCDEKKSREVEVKLSFGECATSLKYQLKQQGFKILKDDILIAEKVRVDLLALHEIDILSSKQLWKCFSKLSKQISKRVVESTIKEGEIATHIKTIKS